MWRLLGFLMAFWAAMPACAFDFGKKSFVIGVEEVDSYPDFAFREQKFTGTGREILDAFAQARGYTFTYRPMAVRPLAEALAKGEVDFKFPDNPAWDTEIKGRQPIRYSRALVHTVGGAMVRPDRALMTMDEVGSLGIVSGYTAVGWQDRIRDGKTKLVAFPDVAPMVKAGMLADVDAVYGSVNSLRFQLTASFRKPNGLVFAPLLPSETTSLQLSTLRHPEVIAALDDWMTHESPELRAIKETHHSDVVTTATAAAQALHLFPEEENWLVSHTDLRIGVLSGMPPFSQLADGTPQGFSIDFAILIGEKLGVDVAFVGSQDGATLRSMLARREIDFVANVSQEGEKGLIFTEPVAQAPFVIVGMKGASQNQDLLHGGKVAVRAGSAGDIWAESRADIQRLACALPAQCLDAVLTGAAQVAIEREIFVRDVLRAPQYRPLIAMAFADDGGPPGALRYALRGDDDLLRGILDKAIAAVRPDEVQALQAKWFSPPPDMVKPKARFEGENARAIWTFFAIGGVAISALLFFFVYRRLGK